MAPESQSGFGQLLTEQIGSLVHTVADLSGMTEAQRAAKFQSVTDWLLSFQPSDGIEIMLASHCVIYDRMLQAAAREFSCTPDGPVRQRTQSGILATGKTFLYTINILLRKQGRATIAKTTTARTVTPEAPPRETAEPAMPFPTQDFAIGPVHVPRAQQPADPARFGAAFRQRDAAIPDRPPATKFNLPCHLNGPSRAAMLIASGLVDLRRVTPAPPPRKTSKVKQQSATELPWRRRTPAPRAAVPRYAQPTTATGSPPGRAPPV
jgi:hypothetical protein